ncbi:hypothetical protein DI392_14480 [Vibrio albus]|uniref:Uncharacterized protein n=1 Tax=Vibrio albus TaxID=2200953 RepID=A0A2U3B784_9VIBR|nr:thrombospondin type 3 repeat-containing protein [Vibrio albus]PWI32622.1 hypothetical protein DI392_14480 [Vibrio albus]
MKKSQIALALGVASTTLLTGCGGGDSSSETTSATSYSVKAIDGYLRNATIWLDINGNYQWDEGEPKAISGAGGEAVLDVSGIDDPTKYSVVVQATSETVDEDTITEDNPDGTPVETSYVMSAPAGETSVTPLSTKVNLVLEKKKAEASATELTDDEIEALKQEAVHEVAGENLDPDLVLGDYVAAKTVNDDASDEEKEAAREAARIAYEAKVIVQSKQLPQEPEELDEAVDEIKTDPTASSLLNQLDAVSDQTQKAIETKAKEAESDEAAASMDFDTLALPDFVEDTEKVNDLTDDRDNDGVANAFDAFPDNASEWRDSDGDGIGNNSDDDIDGDGFANDEDALPLNAKEWLDTDEDGIGNNADKDDDNDGVTDDADAFPLNKDETSDLDKDGIGDNSDDDIDGDNILNVDDQFPRDKDASVDTDNDGIADVNDDDDDNDGVVDAEDAFPLNASESLDTDKDGIGNEEDDDDDGDKIPDAQDAFPLDPTESVDTDGDNIGNNADNDDDGDGYSDLRDYFPLDASRTSNGDYDNDGVSDVDDAFPEDASETKDSDRDGTGDNADTDDDNDGVADTEDAFPYNPKESTDSDEDGVGDNSDKFPTDASEFKDSDGDGVGDNADVFRFDESESTDIDNDGIGDNADTDDDNDGVLDTADAFPTDATESVDSDKDGIGNNADTDDDNDGVLDAADAFPTDATESVDSDGDGIGDNADTDDSNTADTDDSNTTADTDESSVGDNSELTALEFLRSADALYELHSDNYNENGTEYNNLFVSSILINGNIGVTQTPQVVNPDGSLSEVTEKYEDIILTADGWVPVTSHTLDATTDTPIAYPTNIPDSKMNVTLELVDLSGETISSASVPFWSDFVSTTAQFPSGSQAVKFTPVAAQDIYSLWSDSEVHISTDTEPYHAAATSLDQLISTTAIDSTSTTQYPNLVYFGWDMGVELVEDGTANYYITGDSLINVGSGTWTRSVINGEDILQFTVPDSVVSAYGDQWDEDSSTLFASVYDDGSGSYVHMGSVEKQGTSFDEVIYLFNETAKSAILDQVVISASSTDNTEETSGADTTDSSTDTTDSGTDTTDSGTDTTDSGTDTTDSGTDTTDSGTDTTDSGTDTTDSSTGTTDSGTDTSSVDTASDALAFVRNADALYELHSDNHNENGTEYENLFVSSILINGNIGVTQTPQVVNPDGSLSDVTEKYEDLILTADGWVQVTSHTLDATTDTPIVYPTNVPDSKMNVTLELVDLSGEIISPTTVPFWSDFVSTTAQFPSGSQAVKFTPVAAQDIYSLWSDSEVHISTDTEPYHTAATSLDQLISATAVDSTSTTGYPNLVYFGWDMGVELVEDGTANYYITGDSLINVGSGTWTRSVINGEDILQFTVPDGVVSAYGDQWDEDSSTLFASVYDDGSGSYVHMGSVEKQGTSFDEVIYLFNETAKSAILEQVDVSVTYTDSTDSDTSTTTDSTGSDTGSYTDSTGSDTVDSSSDNTSDSYEDLPALAEGVGSTTSATNADIVQLVESNSGLHEFDKESENSIDILTVDTFAVNGSYAISQGFKVVMPDSTLGSAIYDDEQLILAGSSWVTPTGYTLDISGTTAEAYPTGYAEIKYSLGTPMITDLTDEAINGTNLPFWSAYKTDSATFPTGAQALQFTPIAAQDIYSLWTDSDVHVKVVGATASGPYSVQATTLADLTSASAATDPAQAKVIYIGWNIGVELVEDGTANFYQTDDTTYETSKVGETTWTSSEMGGKTVYQLTVTDEAILAFGDAWYDDPATILFAENNGIVIRGAVEKANETNDYMVTFFNDVAYQSILDEVEISCDFTYTEGDSTYELLEFTGLLAACSSN